MPRVVVGSEFFLDHDRWQALRGLLAPGAAVDAWSAGCHTGKEPYSLAILLEEVAPGAAHRILATDADPGLLARARAGGPFPEAQVGRLTPEQRGRYLEPGGPPHFVRRALISRVTFEVHDVREAPARSGLDLILFRDVEPFFSTDESTAAYARLHSALRPGGLLFVGSTDAVPGAGEIGLEPIEHGFYRRAAS